MVNSVGRATPTYLLIPKVAFDSAIFWLQSETWALGGPCPYIGMGPKPCGAVTR